MIHVHEHVSSIFPAAYDVVIKHIAIRPNDTASESRKIRSQAVPPAEPTQIVAFTRRLETSNRIRF